MAIRFCKLREPLVTNLENRFSPEFTNPDDAGLDKLTSTWLHEALFRTCIEEDSSLEPTNEENKQSVDIHYEIADVF